MRASIINIIIIGLFTTIRKDQKGGYAYKLGTQNHPHDKDKDYTLYIEILNADYQLWHK